MRVIGYGIFSMLRNRRNWNYMHCFQTSLGPDNIYIKILHIKPHMLNEIKRRPIKVTPKDKK